MSDESIVESDRRRFLGAVGAAGAATALGGVAAASDDPAAEREELLVGVSAGTDMDTVVDRLPADAELLDREEDLRFLRVGLSTSRLGLQRLRAEASIASVEGVKYTEPNARHAAFEAPSDPRFEDQYAPQQVRAPEAWERTEGDMGVTVAVVDQGVKYDHPDLAERFDENKGRDFVDDTDDDPYPADMDEEYHGTHVAGIASATTNNDAGIAGMSDSRLLSCRALGTYGFGSTADIAKGVRWATQQGADLINMSLGGGGFSETFKSAVAYAVDNGALPVCAAGNDGSEGVSYPAAYEECVAVSALEEGERFAYFSQYGDQVDVTGPGVDVLSCWTSRPYNRISGTSMSCPAATGVAALALAANPELGPVGLRDVLKQSAVDVGLSEKKQGAGRVDAANAVATASERDPNEPPRAAFSSSETTAAVGQTVEFDASDAVDPDGSIARYEWAFGDGTTGEGQVVEHAYDQPRRYAITLRVYDDDGARTVITGDIGVREDPSESCGAQRETTERTGSVEGDDDSRTYTYEFDTRDPCRVQVSLSGPEDADFDLYLRTDGRQPTTSFYHRKSTSPRSDETIVLDDLDGHTRYRIMVVAADGSGEFTLSVEEFGR